MNWLKSFVFLIGILFCFACQQKHKQNSESIKIIAPKASTASEDKYSKIMAGVSNSKKITESTNANITDPPHGSLKGDSIAMVQIEKLPEYKILLKQFHKLNHDNSNHFVVMLAARPNSSFKYYWIKLGEDNPNRFHEWAHFYVKTKNMAVYYYDTASDSILTLKQWRKSGKYYLE